MNCEIALGNTVSDYRSTSMQPELSGTDLLCKSDFKFTHVLSNQVKNLFDDEFELVDIFGRRLNSNNGKTGAARLVKKSEIAFPIHF